MSERPGSSSGFPRFDTDAGIVVFFVLVLAIFGLVIQTSAGQYLRESMRLEHDPLYTFRMQLIYLVPAMIAGFFFYKVNLQKLRKYVWWIVGLACVLLICARVAIPGVKFFGSTFPGVEVNGSWRWINLGFLRFQASDFAKITLVFALAHYLAGAQRFLQHAKITWWKPKYFCIPTSEFLGDLFFGFINPCLIIGLLCGLVALGPDLGTMALCAAVGFSMLFLSGARLAYLVPVVTAGLAAFSAVVYFWPNRLKRITAFLDPEGTKLEEGYQLWQALLAFGGGGWKGEGLGNGVQYRYFLPEAHTDFVFAVVGEELGFVFASTVVLVFLLIFLVVIFRLRRIPDVFYFNICLGALLFIVLQALINMGVVTGMLPTKGMSLPFVSYGGSNIVVMFSLTGMMLNAMRSWRRSAFPPPAFTGERDNVLKNRI
ncbi:MAG: cell division protein FtsW [Verrucomicrobia bacterium]|nr:cell division protein FtsW [Verrucomicrobiota bacterium]